MQYEKSVGGKWAKGADITSGTRCKITDEARRVESQFKDDEGNPKMQDVCKVRFEGGTEAVNVSLNRATIYGLIDAFGKESNGWIGKVLTAHTEKVVVGGKRVTAMYLVPEGFEVGEDDGGFMEVRKSGAKGQNGAPDAGSDEISPEDIPF